MKKIKVEPLINLRGKGSFNEACVICGLIVTSLGVGLLPSAAVAREARVLEEVVVTARRREESSQDIPVAISVLGGEMLRDQNITELNDLGTQVPSFRVSTGGTSTNEPVLSIRGQRPTDSALSLDAAIPIYFNDVVLTPSTGTNLAMYDLASVQVLKGPQGTLFGRNSTGGALLLTSVRPGIEQGGYLEAKAGSYNLLSLEGAVDVPLTDSLQLRITGRAMERDGYQKNKAGNGVDDAWDEDSKGARISVNYDHERFNNLLVAGFDKNNMFSRVPVPEGFNASVSLGRTVNALYNYAGQIDSALAWQAAHDADEIQSDVQTSDQISNAIVTNATEILLFDDITLKNIAGYRRMTWDRNNDADGTTLPLFGATTSGLGPDDGSVVTRDAPLTTTKSKQYSNEIQLLGSAMEGRLDWITGVYWYKMMGSQSGDSQVVGPNPDHPRLALFPPQFQAVARFGVYQSAPSGEVDNEAYGIFAEGTYRFSDAWSATLGLRQSWDSREVTVRNFGGLGGPLYACAVTDEAGNTPPNCKRTERENFESPTWRISANYTPDDEQLIYASVSSGYRSGGFNIRGTDNASLQPFDEETVLSFEVGHKGDWALNGIPFRTNAAVYYQDYQDIQKTQSVLSSTGGFGTATVNAGEAEIYGFEFDLTLPVTERLTLNAAYSYVATEYKEWISGSIWVDRTNGNRTLVTVDLTDSEFVYMPEQSLTASMRYTFPVPASLGTLSAMASLYWQDAMHTDETSVVYDQQAAFEGWAQDDLDEAHRVSEVDAYTVVNLRMDWRDVMGTSVALAAFVNNATDEEYVTGGLNVIDSLGWAAFTYGAPRTAGISVRYDF